MKKYDLIVHAPNIHIGGGKGLLLGLIANLPQHNSVAFLVDQRLDLPQRLKENGNIEFFVFPASLKGRLRAEVFLSQLGPKAHKILCFGNLPPLFPNIKKTSLFIQNKYMVEKKKLDGFSIFVKLRIKAEMLWLKWGLKYVNEVLVQTPSMAQAFQAMYGTTPTCRVTPFCEPLTTKINSKGHQHPQFEFCYISHPYPHKNFHNLVKAWVILAQEGLFPTLALTLNRHENPQVYRQITFLIEKHHLPIQCLETPEGASFIYSQSKALIFPSSFESLGLPLLEAQAYGLDILASELDYVRDLLDPVETFNPESPLSIARAVKRYLKAESSLTPVIDSKTFLINLLHSNKDPEQTLQQRNQLN